MRSGRNSPETPAYKMEGFDAGWRHTASDRRLATYTNLDPGSYTFRVRAANNDGIWNEAGASLRIVITPPWWQTVWFRLLALSATVGVVFAGYWLRVRSVEDRSHQLEMLVSERTRELQVAKEAAEAASQAKSAFLANVSHDVRMPLNSILGFTRLVRRQHDVPATARDDLGIVVRSAEHLHTLIHRAHGNRFRGGARRDARCRLR